MNVEVNELAVILAGASSMVVGSVWYMPKMFGNSWMKMTKSDTGKGAKPVAMAWMYGSVFLASLVSAYVLANVAFLSNLFFGHSFMQDTLCTAFWLWLGFTAARMYTHDTFEGRRKKLTVLNASHELVTFLVMGLIIGSIGLEVV